MTLHSTRSLADSLSSLSVAEQKEVLNGLTPKQLQELRYQWHFWARPNQIPPEGDWTTWLIQAGRGFGKTRTGAELVRSYVESGRARRIAIVGEDSHDARSVQVEGESGLLAISPPSFMPTFEPSKRKLVWPNGAIAQLYSADDFDSLRGPEFDLAWADELAKYPQPQALFDTLMLALRLGEHPRCLITTTPRPLPLLKALRSDPHTHVTIGSTFENAANLPTTFFNTIVSRYEGTRLGRQEIYAEVLEDAEGALWKFSDIERTRIKPEALPEMKRIVIGVDPAVSSRDGSNETGIVACGLGEDGHGYVLADASGHYTPDAWARRTVELYVQHQADRIVCEANQGGELCRMTLATVMPNVPVKLVHASRGKRARAEPVAALYEQARVSHAGVFQALEDQLCGWDARTSSESPDRLDALVWGLTELALDPPLTVYGQVLAPDIFYDATSRPQYLGTRTQNYLPLVPHQGEIHAVLAHDDRGGILWVDREFHAPEAAATDILRDLGSQPRSWPVVVILKAQQTVAQQFRMRGAFVWTVEDEGEEAARKIVAMLRLKRIRINSRCEYLRRELASTTWADLKQRPDPLRVLAARLPRWRCA